MRLQRALARAGVASRRAAEELIKEGRVRVNGHVAALGSQVDVDRDVIVVGGRRIKTAPELVWIALHKPIGHVVTRRDPEGRPTVFTIVPAIPGLTYVGRLDVMTDGLLLLTNDGAGAHRLMHPRFEVERTYRVLVHGRPLEDIKALLKAPILIDGRRVQVVGHRLFPASRGSTDMLLVLAEGRQRIVRRICEQLGLKVERLTRLSYGPIELGKLERGAWRYLTPAELRALAKLGVGTDAVRARKK
jgi:23S rRNA pseudouridine2605 synthase